MWFKTCGVLCLYGCIFLQFRELFFYNICKKKLSVPLSWDSSPCLSYYLKVCFLQVSHICSMFFFTSLLKNFISFAHFVYIFCFIFEFSYLTLFYLLGFALSFLDGLLVFVSIPSSLQVEFSSVFLFIEFCFQNLDCLCHFY